MFQWASSAFDKLSQTVAPPPEEGPGRFAYLVQQGDEDAAMGCLAEMDPVHSIVNQAKGQYPIHLACQHSCMRLIQFLLNQPDINIGQTDLAGNTPLHYASMSVAPHGLEVVKLLVSSYGPRIVLAKNAQGQTPYDVATKNAIRQHLLPIQLQAETQIALDNGGQGLPPGIDLGGLRISNYSMPPPPTFGGGGGGEGPPSTPGQAPMGGPPGSMGGGTMAPAGMPVTTDGYRSPAQPDVSGSVAHLFGTPSPTHHAVSAPASATDANAAQGPPAAPDSASRGRSHEYSRVGSSSAAMSGVGKYRADGFHSSSSDVSLQRKYGHANTNSYGRTIAPPPSSGNSSVGLALSASTNEGPSPISSSSGGVNPFSAGSAGSLGGRYGALNGRSRYVAYGQVAAPAASAPGPAASYGLYPATAPVVGNLSLFSPGGGLAAAAATTTTTPSSYGAAPAPAITTQSAPTSAGTLTTPYMPPPPFQSHNYFTETTQNSANMADANAKDIFAAPSPQKEEAGPSSAAYVPEDPATVFSAADTTTTNAAEETVPSTTTCEVTMADNWVETVDPSSGQTYYYNVMTNESSWEKPTSTAVPTSQTQMAANWLETVDPSSGQTYYYNSVTHETSWERPMASIVEQLSSEPAVSQGATALGEIRDDSTPTPDHAEVPTESSISDHVPLPVSASDAFSAPPPSEPMTVTPRAAEGAPEFPRAPTSTVLCAAEAFSAPPPSAAGGFVTSMPSQTTTLTSLAGGVAGTMVSPFLANHQRALSADELFAEDPPRSGDEGDNDTSPALVTHQKAKSSSMGSDGADEDLMDDVPLSPTVQQSVAESDAAIANGLSQLDAPTNPTVAEASVDANSLFAAIGMPPPPFSARKR